MVVGLGILYVFCFVVNVIKFVVPYHIYNIWAGVTCKMCSPASVAFSVECTYIRVKSRPNFFPRDDAVVLKRHVFCLGGGNWASGGLVEQLTLPLIFAMPEQDFYMHFNSYLRVPICLERNLNICAFFKATS